MSAVIMAQGFYAKDRQSIHPINRRLGVQNDSFPLTAGLAMKPSLNVPRQAP